MVMSVLWLTASGVHIVAHIISLSQGTSGRMRASLFNLV